MRGNGPLISLTQQVVHIDQWKRGTTGLNQGYVSVASEMRVCSWKRTGSKYDACIFKGILKPQRDTLNYSDMQWQNIVMLAHWDKGKGVITE